MMKRRDFLSMISGGVLFGIVPKKTYFFLNGIFRADDGLVSCDPNILLNTINSTTLKEVFPEFIRNYYLGMPEGSKVYLAN